MTPPSGSKNLEDVRVLITAGPMRAYLDAVRYISNVSTGKLGARIAEECLARGATVTLVHGPGSHLPVPPAETEERLILVEIDTMASLMEALREQLRGGNQQVCVHAMAVLDYVPEQTLPDKFSSESSTWTLNLVRSPKVIEQIKKISPTILLVGFKLEVGTSTEGLIRQAKALMDRAGAEIVVANDLSRIDEQHHPAIVCHQKEGRISARAVDGKPQIARAVCDLIQVRLQPSHDETAAPSSRE
jgi:phosphopantothenoylcysteine synthetase/decarboxylase